MPLQRITMDADYSERLIHPLRQRPTRNPPRAVLISSTRLTTPANSVSTFFNAPFRLPARNPPPRRGSVLVREGVQGRLASLGPFHPGLTFETKTRIRKFEDFSVDGEVAMVRGIPTPLSTLYPRRNTVPKNVYVNDLNFVLPPRLISQPSGQPTTTAPSSTSPNPATENSADLSPSSQQPDGPEPNVPVTNWRQAVVSSCVVGVALVAVATGYACSTVFRGALNVGQFVYTNRESIQQTATTCTQAVQSTYNAAKRRMVSIPVPRLPVGMRRRYAAPQTPRARTWRCRLFRQSRVPVKSPVQSSQPINPVASSLAPDGMPGVEYSGLSNTGQFPDTQDAADPDAFIHPRSFDALASGVPYMTGGLFREPTPPPPSPSPAQDQSASFDLAGNPTPDDMELTEQPCICYAESVFSEDIEDECLVEDGDDIKVPTTALFEDNEGGMELEEDFWFLPGQFQPRLPCEASQRLTNPQAVPTSASPVIETAPLTIEAPAPVIEHASPSPSPSSTIEPGSPLPSPPGAFPPPPPPPPGRPTPPPPPPKAAARQGAKSRKRKMAPGAQMPMGQKNPLPPQPRKRKASSPPKEIRRSNRIAESKY